MYTNKILILVFVTREIIKEISWGYLPYAKYVIWIYL